MIEPLRQVLRAAAVALVEPDDVEAGGKRLVGDAAHVMRLARSLEPVQHDQCRTRLAAGLPVAQREHARVGCHVEISGLGGGQAGPLALAGPRVERHLVPAGPAGKGSV